MLMFCFLHSQLHITTIKTLFARHVKPWPVCNYYSSIVCYIQCWMEVSAVFYAPTAIPTEQEHPHLLARGLGVPQACLGNFEKRKFKPCCESSHDFSVASTSVTAATTVSPVTICLQPVPQLLHLLQSVQSQSLGSQYPSYCNSYSQSSHNLSVASTSVTAPPTVSPVKICLQPVPQLLHFLQSVQSILSVASTPATAPPTVSPVTISL